MDIIWKPIEGFENYSISNTGEICNNKTDHIMLKSISNGYQVVTLSNRGSQTQKYVHRLLMEAFNPMEDKELQNKMVVNHIDGNRSNNDLQNLEWVSIKENNLHARNILHKTVGMPSKAVIAESVDGFGIIEYESISACAKAFGVSRDTIMKWIQNPANGIKKHRVKFSYK